MWIELKNPVEVCTPQGTQLVRRVWDNGVADTLDITFNDGYVFSGTPEHRLFVGGEWTQLDRLAIGMTDGKHTITNIQEGDAVQTYDIEVENEHCFFLENGVLSHNSSALLLGGVSEGINPDPAIVYTQMTAAGEVPRINPIFLDLMKERGKYTKSVLVDISNEFGSVQHLDWLTDEEKEVFKTAFEINQEAVIHMASARQNFICQSQSLNLFFSADEDERWISHVHKLAFESNLNALYYVTTKTGIQPSRDCVACEG